MKIKKFEDWAKMSAFIDSLKTEEEFMWRGHSASSWKLSSSLYRFFENRGVRVEERLVLERKAIERFECQYLRQEEGQGDLRSGQITDLIILMQHYGCPTRMMDWTWSPYIAIYFALPDTTECGALYGLNLTKYQAIIAPKLPLDDYDHGILTSLPEGIFKRFQSTEDLQYPIPLNPKSRSEREYKQQSIFLMDLMLSSPVENILQTIKEEVLWKLEFHFSLREQIFQELTQMNIDGYHLFGGLHGAAIRAKEELFGVPSKGHSINTEKIDF